MIILRINEPEKYFNELAKILSDYDIIKEPKEINKLFETGKLHTDNQGNIVGWQVQSKKIKFWDDAFIDFDENAEKLKYKEYFSLSNCSYHFQPEQTNKVLRQFRVDIEDGKPHANPDDIYDKDHLYSDELKLNIKMFNLVVSVYIAIEYLKNQEKYPIENQYADIYNNIIQGLEGKY